MAWIWSDELAEAAESAGLEHREIAAWRRRPVAFALRSDERPESLAREMLGLPVHDGSNESAADRRNDSVTCNCGAGEVLDRAAVER